MDNTGKHRSEQENGGKSVDPSLTNPEPPRKMWSTGPHKERRPERQEDEAKRSSEGERPAPDVDEDDEQQALGDDDKASSPGQHKRRRSDDMK
ncbi:hypothetical protein [Pandoraea pulmonicola]|uniref:hypothetical protein n=1 Tax=Pandoraea pulmonicola TaxID=93221 RepID=UPI0011C021F2|nr:hypothetical protein [Pandoraea pulmonicola]